MYIDLAGFGRSESFGAIAWNTVFSPAGYNDSTREWRRAAGWEKKLIEILYGMRASDPPDVTTWPRGLDCFGMARSIGQGSIAPAICDRVGPIWSEIQAYIVAKAAEAEAAKWETAYCGDRTVPDGGGSICTATDGASRVVCYHTDGSDPSIVASGPCPPGTGGMPRVYAFTAPPRVKTVKIYPPSSPGTPPVVQGRAVGPGGAPISGALVQFKKPGPMLPMAIKTATTDATGTFRFTTSAGNYELLVQAEGFEGATVASIVVPASGTVDLGDVLLESTSEQVTSCPEGQQIDPVSGECVLFEEKTDEEDEEVVSGMTRGTKIAIGVSVGVVVLLGVAYVVVKRRRG